MNSKTTELIFNYYANIYSIKHGLISIKPLIIQALIIPDNIKEIDLKHFQDNISANIKMTDNGLVIGNIRVVFSWQNGVGLNNPTIRIFLEE